MFRVDFDYRNRVSEFRMISVMVSAPKVTNEAIFWQSGFLWEFCFGAAGFCCQIWVAWSLPLVFWLRIQPWKIPQEKSLAKSSRLRTTKSPMCVCHRLDSQKKVFCPGRMHVTSLNTKSCSLVGGCFSCCTLTWHSSRNESLRIPLLGNKHFCVHQIA